MKGCFSLSQRKALEYVNTGRAVPAETLNCSPPCALQCVPGSQWDCELCLPGCCVGAFAPGTLIPCGMCPLAPQYERGRDREVGGKGFDSLKFTFRAEAQNP